MRRSRKAGFAENVSGLLHSAKFIDRAKNVVIVLLVVSASLLLARTGVLSAAGIGAAPSSAGGQSGGQHGAGAEAKVYAAGPYDIVVTDASGSHCGLMYDGTELKQAYDRLSAYLGEAFGSAGNPERVTREDWLGALKERGVYFDFAYPQPLSLLAQTLGTKMLSSARNHTSARFCIAVEGDYVSLYYLRPRDGGYYKCATAISSEALAPKLGDWPPNGASFLFETGYDFNLVDGCFVVMSGQAQMHAVTAQNPVGVKIKPDDISSLFGVNSYMASSYKDDGTDVYVDGGSILRIYADGRVTFKSSGNTEKTEESDDGFSAALSAAARAAYATVGASGGAASAVLTYIGYDADASEYIVRYGYEINGRPVSTGDVNAAQFRISGGVITDAALYFREYLYSGEDDYPMPPVQEMAVVQAMGGGTPLLCYLDDGEAVAAGWTILN